MPNITLNIPHTLGQEGAIERIKGLLPAVKERAGDKVSNLKEEWQGNKLVYSFTSMGFSVKGDLVVEADQVKTTIGLPFAAMLAKGQIESKVKEEMQKALA